MSGFQPLPVRKPIPTALLRKFLPRWQDNTSPQDLGVVRFGFDLFPNTLDRRFGTADWVRPALFKTLQWFPGMTKIDRAHAICTSRDFSKSTWFGKILPLYFLLVGQYGIYYRGHFNGIDGLLPEADYIRLRAKTGEKAEERLTNVSMEFSNDDVLELFGDLQPSLKEIKTKKLKNHGKLIILRNGYIFQAQGLNQPARGANIRDRRPKFDIDDDVENKENTKTDTMRAYNAKEILGEQFGGLAHDGLTVYIGNYVHSNCIMASLQKEGSGWRRQFYTASYFNEKGEEVSGWAKRYSMQYLKRLGEWFKNQPELGGWKTFRLEFYNEIVSDKDYEIKTYRGRYIRKADANWLEIYYRDEYDLPKRKLIRVYVVVSGDPAISTNKKSSDGAVSVVMFGSDNQRYVHDLSLAKFDIRDRFHKIEDKPAILAKSPDELVKVKRRGLVDEMARYILRYNADAFVLENAGQQMAWFNDLREDLLTPLNISIPGLPYHPTEEKTQKLESGLMNYFSAGRYSFRLDMNFRPMLESQVNTFPDSKLDLLDTLFNAEQMKNIPYQSNIDIYGQKHEDSPYDDEYEFPEDAEPWVLVG